MRFKATDAQPGSEQKIAILERRYANGLALWHPDDQSCIPDSPYEPHRGECRLILSNGARVVGER